MVVYLTPVMMQTVCRKMIRFGLDVSSILTSDPVAACEVSQGELYFIVSISEEFHAENVITFD